MSGPTPRAGHEPPNALGRSAADDPWAVRRLKTQDDVFAFARLRYNVWLKERYVDPATLPNQCCLELDFADFFSEHFGLFDADDQLVGGGRLIHEDEDDVGGAEWIRLLNAIRNEADDPQLSFRLAPRYFALPSDLYGAFPKFIQEYKKMFDGKVKFLEVSRIVVAEDLRGRRLSDILISNMIGYAKRTGFDVLVLTCSTAMESFYNRFGFERYAGVPPDVYGEIKIESIVMSLNLPRRA